MPSRSRRRILEWQQELWLQNVAVVDPRYSILKNKESIIKLYESKFNMSSRSVLSRKRCRESDFSEVNEALYSWYLLAKS